MSLPQTPSFRLDGKRALVVGASSGIGFACAVALAQAGAEVCMAARRKDTLHAAVEELTSAGLAAGALPLDIADTHAIASTVPAAGPFDVLVNAAGIARHAPALETQAADFDAVVTTNLKGAHFLAVAVARGMIEAGVAGSIITVSSQMGQVGGIERSVYAATKHALEGMTKSMAIEWGVHGIRVNTLSPTFIRTPLTEPTFSNPERLSWIQSNIRLGRVGELTDIMGPAVFLASDASALITGTSLLVDGGWTAA